MGSSSLLYVGVTAEMASFLVRNVSYEGPALRRQLAKALQLQNELSRREVECQSMAADMRERFYTSCKQYGIKVRTVCMVTVSMRLIRNKGAPLWISATLLPLD